MGWNGMEWNSYEKVNVHNLFLNYINGKFTSAF